MGLFMFLLMFVVAPIVGMIAAFGLGMDPWPVGIVIFGLGAGGILRILYALMFESKDPYAGLQAREQPTPIAATPTTALPPQSASDYASPASAWREPESRTPASVTETTTKLLDKNQRD
jgi:hypothetical protein